MKVTGIVQILRQFRVHLSLLYESRGGKGGKFELSKAFHINLDYCLENHVSRACLAVMKVGGAWAGAGDALCCPLSV